MTGTSFRHLTPAVGLAILAAACTSQLPPPAHPAPPGTVTQSLVSSKSGRTYRITTLTEGDEASEPFARPTNPLAAASPDNFHGTDRGDAKTSLVDDPQPTTFPDLESFLASPLLVSDDRMIAHDPAITKDRNDPRTEEEQHSVEISAFLYASRKESDNDFHCIVGAAPDHAPAFFNVEVSGLPLGGQDRPSLKAVRDGFKAFFADQLPGVRYSKYDPPIPIHVKGPIFFDIDHPAGKVGPTGMRPTTAWEIHPASAFDFEPDSP